MTRVLVVAMDWGLGHAARCVPIIRALQERGCHVSTASSGTALELLRAECTDVPSFEMPSYQVRYSRRALFAALVLQLPKFVSTVRREHQWVQQFVRANHIDCIISDNRYGCYAKGTHSVLITHQLNVLWPRGWRALGALANAMLRFQIRKFTECWVPDSEETSLAGVLTKSNVSFRKIGFLSRFHFRGGKSKVNAIVILLSGPEPQRTMLEEMITHQLKEYDGEWLLVRGVPCGSNRFQRADERTIDFLPAAQLQEVIERAEIVVCRSGYSTLMDLIALKKRAVLIPTPGQTEQEYLARYCTEKMIAGCVEQSHFNLKSALAEVYRFTGFGDFSMRENLLRAALDELVKQVESQ